MNLQTKIPLTKASHNQIDYHSKVLLLGSCFSENIGAKFDYFKFQNLVNPFGILFHPLAIESFITNPINEKEYTEKDLFFHTEQWHCFEAHSKLSNSNKDELIQNLNTQIQITNSFLKDATHIIITLGTAWVYRHIETDTFVANCHKVPQKKFQKTLLSVDTILESIDAILSLIISVNPKASIIFTVSPVRHLKDGFVENTQSKAHLISSIHSVLSLRAESISLNYFPSYEIMMDELRDYRFYNADMLHPNTIAIDYIWDKFKKVWIDEASEPTMKTVDTIQKGLAHKPFNPQSDAHKAFMSKLDDSIKNIKEKYSHISF